MPSGVYKHKKGLHPATEFKKGHKPFNWKGGKYKHKKGYIYIFKPNHPFCDKRKYVFEHRLAVEKQIGRYLLPIETCHHINGIKDDNRIENLMAFVNISAHLRFEGKGKIEPDEIIFDGRAK